METRAELTMQEAEKLNANEFLTPQVIVAGDEKLNTAYFFVFCFYLAQQTFFPVYLSLFSLQFCSQFVQQVREHGPAEERQRCCRDERGENLSQLDELAGRRAARQQHLPRLARLSSHFSSILLYIILLILKNIGDTKKHLIKNKSFMTSSNQAAWNGAK